MVKQSRRFGAYSDLLDCVFDAVTFLLFNQLQCFVARFVAFYMRNQNMKDIVM